ncbi:ribosome maturation factor RimP [Thermohalobacter berrensis]|uniref:Ribosome maturation factor RimP n=1 Tax=Thermohalobacter berrensis TaxID=99594 RepID=A0A419TAG5_9FIRM|nr:ribosome maturation factor RimP [Thermohalobacter berrensis]RKD34474.1 ribosome maturation factor RimP [Thermohalobacter berrensis]
MSTKKEIEKIVKDITIPILDDYDFELVDVEYVKEGSQKFLRVYIDKPGGITIDDCQKVSERLSDKLDEIDPIEERYFLEVSSPGIDRPLKTDRDLERNLNKDVEVSLYKPIDGKRKFMGKLIKFDDDKIQIEDESVGTLDIEKKIIAKINLAVKFE